MRRERKAKPARLIAYDFETTRIQAGTPRPLYLTAYGQGFQFAESIRDMEHLRLILRNYFLTEDKRGAKYVAWNGNRFDAFFIAAALVRDPDYRLRPYLTRSNTLRGLRILRAEDADNPRAAGWEFLDGIAMLGLAGVNLEKLLANFAPEHRKMTGAIDFDSQEFDATNPAHCEYAMRDSVGLYHAMQRAQSIMLDTFNEPLAVTMGGVCIKIFSAHIPDDVTIESMPPEGLETVRRYVMRGGFCYCVRRYDGPIWKYDINQAYASAMREASLPCGGVLHFKGPPGKRAKAYIARCRGSNPANRIPFYYRTEISGRVRAVFATTEIADTWLTSIEIEQLQSEGWKLEILECWQWSQAFQMREFVDKLETLRRTCDGGPSGPIGTMVKATGNHSYGKTVEQIEPIEFVLAGECPEGYEPYYADGFDPISHVFWRFDTERKPKAYHQPQIGSFITAHVRMVLRRVALLNPDAWLYADTDCVVFSEDMTDRLDIDSARYGAWKIEESGARYRIIAKKVYAQVDGSKRSAKGLNVRRLSAEDFADWYEGKAPVQDQTQLNNFLTVLQGAEMYRTQRRQGTQSKSLPR